MPILDRYVTRQTLPPFLLALGVFTFVLAVQPMLDRAQDLLAKGVPVPTVGVLLLLLLPSALSLTIPMAFLTGLLMALGRLSGDRESVALLACGVSPFRLLRPVLVLALVVAGLDMYVLVRALPDANQAYRSITWRLLTEQTAAEIRARVFFERFPGMVLYINDQLPDGRWAGVFVADVTDIERPSVTLAETGRLVADRAREMVRLELDRAVQYAPARSGAGDRVYTVTTQDAPISIRIPAESVFGSGTLLPGLKEMTYTQLWEEIEKKRASDVPPHAEIMQIQQMFSFPVACIVFAVIAVAIGLNTRKEGRLAGLTLGLGVILVYYAVFALAEAWTKGVARTGEPVEVVATWARWIPNLVMGAVGALALWRQSRPSGLTLPIPTPRWIQRLTAADQPTGDQPVMVVKLPRFGLPAPRLLDRYVTGRFARTATLAFLGLLVLYYVGAFVDLAGSLRREGDGAVFLNLLIQSTPMFVSFIIPIATLIAVLGTIGGLTRTGELTVMRACGVSLYRAAAPLLLLSLVSGAVLFVLEDRVLGESNREAAHLRNQLRDGERLPEITVTNQNWLVGEDGRIYYYALFAPPNRLAGTPPVMQALSVFEPQREPYRLRSHLYASRASFENGAWQLSRGWQQTFPAGERQEYRQRTAELAPAEDFQRARIDASAMSFGELREYVRRLGASGFNVAEPAVNLHRKLAFPMVTLVMTMLAIPFGVTIGRKGALYGVGLATILAAGYFLLMTFFMAVGAAGLMPAPLAAWAANLLFGAAAAFMVLTVRT